MSAAKQASVRFDGELVDICVAQDGLTTWRAWGQFRGQSIDATGSSEANAKDQWQQNADYTAVGWSTKAVVVITGGLVGWGMALMLFGRLPYSPLQQPLLRTTNWHRH